MEGYPQVRQMLHQVQWLKFVEKFNGYDKEVTNSFSQTFDGVEVEIANVKTVFIESFIKKVTRLPSVCEIWFKNRGIEGNEWKTFFRNPGMETSFFKKHIPHIALKIKWTNLILVIQKFITCEGTFGSMFFYNMHLMMHFLKGSEISFPCFLLNSLKKITINTQRKVQEIENTMYHHSLIKILIEATLKNIGDYWESFLVRNHFK